MVINDVELLVPEGVLDHPPLKVHELLYSGCLMLFVYGMLYTETRLRGAMLFVSFGVGSEGWRVGDGW